MRKATENHLISKISLVHTGWYSNCYKNILDAKDVYQLTIQQYNSSYRLLSFIWWIRDLNFLFHMHIFYLCSNCMQASSTVDARRIQSGLLELAKGIFRYSGEVVEFTDRLVFLTAERRLAQVFLRSPYYQTPASSPVWRCVRPPPSKPEVVLVNVDTDELDSYVCEKIKREQSRKRPIDNR